MKPLLKLKTASQFLEHYYKDSYFLDNYEDFLKAMRHYARVKSDIAYEKGYQTAINQMK